MPSEAAERLYGLAEKWVEARADMVRCAASACGDVTKAMQAIAPQIRAAVFAEHEFCKALTEALPAKPFACRDCGSTGPQGRMSTGELIPICAACKALADREAEARVPVVSLGQGTSRVDVMEGDLVRSKA